MYPLSCLSPLKSLSLSLKVWVSLFLARSLDNWCVFSWGLFPPGHFLCCVSSLTFTAFSTLLSLSWTGLVEVSGPIFIGHRQIFWFKIYLPDVHTSYTRVFSFCRQQATFVYSWSIHVGRKSDWYRTGNLIVLSRLSAHSAGSGNSKGPVFYLHRIDFAILHIYSMAFVIDLSGVVWSHL